MEVGLGVGVGVELGVGLGVTCRAATVGVGDGLGELEVVGEGMGLETAARAAAGREVLAGVGGLRRARRGRAVAAGRTCSGLGAGVSAGGKEGRSVGVDAASLSERAGEGVGRPLVAVPLEARDRSGMTPE